MKNLSLLLIVLIGFQALSFGQESDEEFETLFKQTKKTSVSGFGGVGMEFSSVDNNFGFALTGQAAALFNKSFFIGIYGSGLVNFPKYEIVQYSPILNQNATYNKNLMFFHAGLYSGFIFMPNKPIHFGISSKFGWGGITLIDEFYKSNHNNGSNYYNENSVDFVFVVTPQLEAEFNVTNWFKVNLGLGYRFVTGIDKTYLFEVNDGSPEAVYLEQRYFEDDAFNSVTFQVGFLFGWYK